MPCRSRYPEGLFERMPEVIAAAILGLLASSPSWSSGTITDEPEENSYHYTSHYSIDIAASAEEVWKHLVDLGSWMHDLEMAHVGGTPGAEGEVLRLYPGQDFLVQVIRKIRPKLLVIANLPSTFRDEFSTGSSVITLHQSGDITTVDMTNVRRYTWRGEGPNPVKEERSSPEFSDNAREMWQERFLGRLRALAEHSETL